MEAHLIPNSDEWKSWRRGMVMATDSSIILGINKYKSPFKLWQQKLCLIPDDEVNERMALGSKLEPIARNLFIEVTGIFVEPKVVINPNINWMGASLDGLSECGMDCLEIKISKSIFDNACNDIIDESHLCQMQHQMAVLGIGMVHFFAYWDGFYRHIKVYRDDKFIKEMIEADKAFYDSLNSLEAPFLCDRDYQVKYGREFEDKVSEWKHAKQYADDYKDIEDKLRKDLIKMCDGQSSIGAGIKLTKYVRRGTIEYNKIPELTNVNLDVYRKPHSEQWKLTYMNDEN